MMTQEQKAKAYDEALERARKYLYDTNKRMSTEFFEATEKAFIEVFPQLRESEDENLKNKSGYYKAGKFWKASTLWNAVKGKSPQKVPNRYILQECTWNISSLQHFADEVKNVQEVNLDYPIILDMNGNILDGAHRVVKAYLEDKDIDIVYLGDDEWPEPDYDEEKAVKESEDERIRNELVNFILYKAGHLLDEETEHSFVAYLEKQKESLHISETCKENHDSFTDKDERIRKAIVEHFEAFSPLKLFGKGGTFTRGQVLAYLEKQKEQSLRDFIDDFPYSDEQKEREPVEYLPKQKVFDIMNKLTNLSYSERIPIDSEEYVKIHEITSDVNSLLDYPIKPVDWSEEDIDALRDAICAADILAKDFKKDNPHLAKKLRVAKEWLESLPARFTFAIKQEWDEFDEDCLKRAIWYVENPAPSVVKDSRLVVWLNMLRSRFFLKPQPKAEWSEEDINDVIERLELAYKETKNEMFLEDILRLKSLRSQKKDSNYEYGYIDGLAEHWKPSEEQMRSLEYFISLWGNSNESLEYTKIFNDVKSLLEQLKKL